MAPPCHAPTDTAPHPATARRDGWTPERQVHFLRALLDTGSPTKACAAVGLSRASAYALRKRPRAVLFAAAWDQALRVRDARRRAEAAARLARHTRRRRGPAPVAQAATHLFQTTTSATSSTSPPPPARPPHGPAMNAL